MRLIRFLAFLLLVLPTMNGCVHRARVTRAVEEPLYLKLTVSPSVGFAPLNVLASIRVVDDRRVLVCPAFNLVWGIKDEPAESSGFPGDSCWEDGPRVHSPRPRILSLRYPGEYLIIASMADQGVSLSDRATVSVHGRTE